ncbi:MAG: hypothetical protein IIA02_15950 [Proteobacteria bacterium]|uniref:hypothetical protein n=1 Tax=Aquabacterium sp. TaxID=1872578 RepID=UPI0035C6A18A|nr:hypothetical protein [Pseudomonadota bacterium]
MNWLDNVSSDLDQPIAAACLMQGHWLHALGPFSPPVMCRIVLDVADPRVVAAQVVTPGQMQHLDSDALADLSAALLAQEVHRSPAAWGLSPCARLPAWARPSFSERQIEELERLQGYLEEVEDDGIDDVLLLRDDFLRGLGMSDHDMHRAVRQAQGGAHRRGGRLAS